MPRKRRPGGGRKPQGNIQGKGENFSTRITAETREALEREASASGQSISQVAERLLMLGLREKTKRDRPLRALCYVIEQIALGLSSGRWMDPAEFPVVDVSTRRPLRLRAAVESMRDEWRTEPFNYRAFKIAVGMLLNALEPKGELKSPHPAEEIDKYLANAPAFLRDPALVELMKRKFASPENLAADVFSNVWARLNRARGLSESELRIMRRGEYIGEIMREEFYGMADARVDLNLGSKGEGK